MSGSQEPDNGPDSPLDVPCDYCGALAMEPCNWDCLGEEENN